MPAVIRDLDHGERRRSVALGGNRTRLLPQNTRSTGLSAISSFPETTVEDDSRETRRMPTDSVLRFGAEQTAEQTRAARGVF